jgi:hypothetical protein
MERFGQIFAPGEKVMRIDNDYVKEVYNGDTGHSMTSSARREQSHHPRAQRAAKIPRCHMEQHRCCRLPELHSEYEIPTVASRRRTSRCTGSRACSCTEIWRFGRDRKPLLEIWRPDEKCICEVAVQNNRVGGFLAVSPSHTVVRLGFTDIDDGGFSLRQRKTGREVWCPIVPELAAEMATWEKRPGPFLQQNNGRPYTRKLFWQHFDDARAGIPELADVTLHGLRCTDPPASTWAGGAGDQRHHRYVGGCGIAESNSRV